MHGWIDYYETATPALEPGHIWCDRPLYLPARQGLKITRVNPRDDTDLDFRVCSAASKQIFDHAPIMSLGMESNEGVVVAKTKQRRPVIILGGGGSTEMRPGKLEGAETLFVVPVYGADQFDAATRRRMALYEYQNVFYLAANESPRFDEGFARLDHAQSVFTSGLTDHRGIRLSSDALELLYEWFTAFSTLREPTGSLIPEYRAAEGSDAGGD